MVGRGGHLVCQQRHEDDEGQQYGQAEAHLLARRRRQHEDEEAQDGHDHHRHDQVQPVKVGLPLELELECDLGTDVTSISTFIS